MGLAVHVGGEFGLIRDGGKKRQEAGFGHKRSSKDLFELYDLSEVFVKDGQKVCEGPA